MLLGIRNNNLLKNYMQKIDLEKPKLLILNNYNKIKFPERFRGTILERWADYWKALSHDYYEVLIDTTNWAKSNTGKAAGLTVSFVGLWGCARLNPDENHFRDMLLKYNHEMIFIGNDVRNPSAANYLKFMESAYNEGLIKRFSLGFLSITWLSDNDNNLGLYKANCKYLGIRWNYFWKRIIDIGFLDKWWIMDKKMLNYDINPNEWSDKT